VQEVFLVVHRKRGEFEGRASLKTWIFRILVRVAADQRRSLRRKSPHLQPGAGAVDPTTLPTDQAAGPHERTALREAGELLHQLLDQLSDDKRAIFVLAELEELPVPEVAETLGINLNTAYARLRSARHDFEKAVKRVQARDGWRVR
jgi:RNA polymerase sigma-70 factor (ECF subfamily)